MNRRNPLADPKPLIRRLYSYVAYRIGDGPEAEDVTSEAFERAIRYRQTYDPGRGAPITWLVGIARRCIADRPRVDARLEPDAHEEHAASTEAAQIDALTVRAAVAQLSERDQELVALRYGADLTARQIAAELGVQTNAVEVALHRLHARLRADLAAEFQPAAARKDLGPAAGM